MDNKKKTNAHFTSLKRQEWTKRSCQHRGFLSSAPSICTRSQYRFRPGHTETSETEKRGEKKVRAKVKKKTQVCICLCPVSSTQTSAVRYRVSLWHRMSNSNQLQWHVNPVQLSHKRGKQALYPSTHSVFIFWICTCHLSVVYSTELLSINYVTW